MPNKDPVVHSSIINWFLIAIAVAFAAVGGVAKYLADVQEGKEVFAWFKLIIQGFISAFAGSVATLYMIEYGFSTYMVVLGSGLFGFGGVVLLRLVIEKITTYIGSANQKGGNGE